jgi:hypothetical protein
MHMGKLPTTQNLVKSPITATFMYHFHQLIVIDYLIWKSVIDFIVVCFDFDGIILQHVTPNLAQFTCLADNYVIFWHQM